MLFLLILYNILFDIFVAILWSIPEDIDLVFHFQQKFKVREITSLVGGAGFLLLTIGELLDYRGRRKALQADKTLEEEAV